MVGQNVFQYSEHNHDEDEDTEKVISMMQLRSDIKTLGVLRPDEKPLHLITECVQSRGVRINERQSSNIRRALNRRRRKVFKRIPRSKADAMDVLREMMTEGDELVQSVDNNIVIIGRMEDLHLLNEENLQLFADGTFKFSPRHFKQMYSLFVFNKGYYIPVLHVLLQDKKEKTYKRALNNIIELCNKCGINIKENIDSVMIDFELAMVKAVKSVFRGCHIKGCKFHLGQSWWRKIKELGLSPIYRNMKSAHGKWLRGLFGLSLLPPSAVPNVFLEYSSSRFLRQPTEQINKMVQYLKTYYCIISASFKPEMWAGLDAIGKSTNNGAESFHRHFGDLFGYLRCKPSLPHFLRNMTKYNAYKDMKLISFKPSRVICNEAQGQFSLYQRKRINVRTLLYRLSKKNQPKLKSVYKRKSIYKAR